MSTASQIAANQENAQKSTGPRTEAGKAISALNNLRHGFTGGFCILAWENQGQYDLLYGGLLEDHQPSNTTEHLLVKTMAQSYWLRERALTLQGLCFNREVPMCDEDFEKQLALYIRYQTTHDRAFNKALDQIQKLTAEKRNSRLASNRSSANKPSNKPPQPAAKRRKHVVRPPKTGLKSFIKPAYGSPKRKHSVTRPKSSSQRRSECLVQTLPGLQKPPKSATPTSLMNRKTTAKTGSAFIGMRPDPDPAGDCAVIYLGRWRRTLKN